MNRVNRACVNCKFFSRYYIKGLNRFEKQKLGFCSQCEQIKDKDGICEQWEHDVNSGRARLKQARKDAILRNINSATVQIAELIQILKEGSEEAD